MDHGPIDPDPEEEEEEASSMAQDSDYEYDSDGGGAPAEASSSGRWLADHHKRRRWEAKEKELRAAMAQENTQKESKALGLAAAAGARAPRNVFSGAASFKVLAADLLALQHDAEDGAGAGVRIEAEAVGDSVYHWSVRLSRFAAGSPAQKFLGLLERAHGYGHVELDVRFAMDLYPFFPPVVRLVRPRVGDDALQRVAQLPSLRLSGWDSVRGMAPVLRDVAAVVAAEVAATAPPPGDARNDPYATHQGAYAPLEHVLMRLGLLTETPPRRRALAARVAGRASPEPGAVQREKPWRPAAGALDPLAPAPAPAPAPAAAGPGRRADRPKRAYWAAGTGYGHDNSTTTVSWDVDAYLAAQRETDRLLSEALREVRGALDDTGRWPGDMACVGASALVPVLATYLRNESLVDASRHAPLYSGAMRLLSAVAAHVPACLVGAVDDDAADGDASARARLAVEAADAGRRPEGQSLYGLTRVLKDRLRIFERATAKETGRPAAPGAPGAAAAPPAVPPPRFAGARRRRTTTSRPPRSCRSSPRPSRTSTRPCGASPAARSAPRRRRRRPRSGVRTEDTAPGADAAAPGADAEAAYKAALGPLQYDDADDAAQWRLPAAAAPRPHPAFRRRLAQEHVDVSHSLPLNLASSAWCRCHPSRMDALRVAISAPEGTPYAAGVFVFDVRFPPSFPAAPPSVTMLTTGRGTVRFNPNLYECGKVCLSLLGTWEGKGGETWNAETSTLLQVLVSIQALIFVSDPYYNEPGFEAQMGTPVGDHRAAKYAATVREHGALGHDRPAPEPGARVPRGRPAALRAPPRLRARGPRRGHRRRDAPRAAPAPAAPGPPRGVAGGPAPHEPRPGAITGRRSRSCAGTSAASTRRPRPPRRPPPPPPRPRRPGLKARSSHRWDFSWVNLEELVSETTPPPPRR